MITGWFPHNQAQKAGRVYLEVMKKYPRDKSLSKVLLDNAIAATKEGYKGVTAVEVKEGKLVDYIALTNKRLIMLAEGINDYKFQIETLSSINEAMDVLGLKPPE